MADSIRERIRDNILTTLAGISTSSGYANTVTVEARRQWGNDPADRKLVVYQAEGSEMDVAQQNNRAKQWSQRFAVECYALESETSTTAIDDRINTLLADVEKALMVDYGRGGLAIDTSIVESGIMYFEGGQAAGGVLAFDVYYQTDLYDPAAQ